MNAQAENVKKTTQEYANNLMKDMGLPEQARRPIEIAFMSGLLNMASVLAMNDGIHPSKILVGIREAGTEWLGLKLGRVGDGEG